MNRAEMKMSCVEMNEPGILSGAPIAVCLESLALRHFELERDVFYLLGQSFPFSAQLKNEFIQSRS
jgi:hypothetical protein